MAEAYSKDELDRRMNGAVSTLQTELGGLRTGRASAALLDSTHGYAKPVFVANGSPRYPTPAQIDAEVQASLVVPTGIALSQLGGGKVSVTLPDLEPYATAHLVIEFALSQR